MYRFVNREGSLSPFFLHVFLALSLILSTSAPSLAQRRASNPIVVQVAAFKSRVSADDLAAALKSKGLSAAVVPGTDVHRVVVGPFPDDAAANAGLAKLKSQGYDGYIRKDLALSGAGTSASAPAPARATPPPAPRRPVATPAAPRTTPAPAPVNPPAVITGVTNQPTGTQPPANPTPPEPATPPAPVTPEPAPTATAPAPPPEPEPTPAPVTTTQTEPPAPELAPPAEPAAPAPAAANPPVVETQQVVTAAESQPPPAPRPSEPAVQPGQIAGSRLRLLVLEGAGAINNTRQRTAREPVVQVVDENDKPVAGVAITFALPSRGASGVFANGARSMTVMTNAQGTATATGFAPNGVAGELSMQVTGSYQGQTLSTTIAQTNVAAAGGMSAATIGIIGAVAAGAAVGAVVALTGGDSTPTPTRPSGTASVRPGGVTIGAPAN